MDAFDLRKWSGFSSAGGCLSEPMIIDQIAIDSRRIDSQHSLFVALKGDREDGHHYIEQAAQAGAKFAFVSKSWQPSFSSPKLTLLRVNEPLEAFQVIAKTYRMQLSSKIIGITGSFGKTMVKDFLYALLGTQKQIAASPESFNSQIGVPLSLFTIRQEHEIAIIEAAISQKKEMDVLTEMIQPDYTLLTPLGKKHLLTLGDIPTLANETLKLIKATPSQGWALLPNESYVTEQLPSFSFPSFFLE